MFKLLNNLFKIIFRLLGIPNPSFEMDSIFLGFFLLVYVVSIPTVWCSDSFDLLGKVFATAFLSIVLIVCILVQRSKSASGRKESD